MKALQTYESKKIDMRHYEVAYVTTKFEYLPKW